MLVDYIHSLSQENVEWYTQQQHTYNYVRGLSDIQNCLSVKVALAYDPGRDDD